MLRSRARIAAVPSAAASPCGAQLRQSYLHTSTQAASFRCYSRHLRIILRVKNVNKPLSSSIKKSPPRARDVLGESLVLLIFFLCRKPLGAPSRRLIRQRWSRSRPDIIKAGRADIESARLIDSLAGYDAVDNEHCNEDYSQYPQRYR